MTKVYISGAIAQNPNFIADFAKTEQLLKGLGYDVVNPTRISGAVEYFDYADFMITSLMLLKKCDAIYFMSNWRKSDGCYIEKRVAQKMGIKIMHESYLGITNPNRRKRTKGQDNLIETIIQGGIDNGKEV